MWQLKTTTTPVIMGALCMIRKRRDKHINKIAASLSNYEMKETTFCKIVHLLLKIPSM